MLSQEYFSGDGSTTEFNVSFPYLSRDHVKVSVDQVDQTFTWVNGTRISLSSAPAVGAEVRVYRDTPLEGRLVEFHNGSILTQDDLNTADLQLFYKQQEIADQRSALFSRVLQLPYGETAPVLPPAAERAGLTFVWDANGDPAVADAIKGDKGDPGSSTMAIGLFTDAPSLSIPLGTDMVHTSGYSVVGTGSAFYQEDASVDAAYVATHPRSSFISANGRGFRLNIPAYGIDLTTLGAIPDDTTDTLPAIQEAISLVNVPGLYDAGRGGPKLILGPGKFYSSGTIHLNRQIELEGWGSGQAGGTSTTIRFPADTRGFVINRHDTDGDNVVPSNGEGADGTIIRNIQLRGSFSSNTVMDRHGIYSKVRIELFNVNVYSFGGHGVYIYGEGANAAAPGRGNANSWRIWGGRYEGNRLSGIRVEGADVNTGFSMNIDATANGRYGIDDRSFLGNTHIASHVDFNGHGIVSFRSGPGIVTHNGKQYYVVVNKAAAASTTEPGTDDTVWRPIKTSEGNLPAEYAPAWVSGGTYEEGGAAISLSAAAGSRWFGFHSESNQAPLYLVGPAVYFGGIHGAGVDGDAAGIHSHAGRTKTFAGYTAETNIHPTLPDYQSVTIGGDWSNSDILNFIHKTEAPSNWRLKYRGNKNLSFNYANSTLKEPFIITGEGTNYTFERGAAQPYRMALPEVFLGNPANGARSIKFGTGGAPTAGAHARGDITLEPHVTEGGPVGYMCSSGGTPGAHVPFGIAGAEQAASLDPSTATVADVVNALKTAKLMAP